MDGLELWLIRHGESTHNREGRIQGQLDTKLTDTGIRQAKALSKRLAAERFDEVYSSDLERAHHTAQLALPGAEVKLDKRLREISFGVLEGKTKAELNEQEREYYTHFNGDRFNRALPGGESWQAHIARTASWLTELPRQGRVIAFTHGGSIRATVFHVLQHHPIDNAWHIVFGNTCINKFRLTSRTTFILGINDAAHVTPELEGSTYG